MVDVYLTNDKHACQKPNARQAEELAKAPPEKQAEIWDAVVEEHGNGLVTT